jgi:large subunit ribosomal protein L30
MGKKKAESKKKIRIRQVRSIIGGTERQRAILRSLGLKKMNQEVVHPANPAILGMVRSIPHLLEVSEEK